LFEKCSETFESDVIWYCLPYIGQPQTHEYFKIYFHKRWFATLSISLRNFLSSVFEIVPLPKLLGFNIERNERKNAQIEIRNLKIELEKYKTELKQANAQCAQLKEHVTNK
jgi:hypothetical protein